jgi:hypothetical protein
MKTYLDTDPLMNNPNNAITNEIQQGIKADSSIRLNHDIYFAESVSISKVIDTDDIPLLLGTDYEFADLDDVATEITGKECYRKIKFFEPHYVIKVSYHAYGDFLKADDINDLINDVEVLKTDIKADLTRRVIHGDGNSTSFEVTDLPQTAYLFKFTLNSIPLEESDYTWTFPGTTGNLTISGFIPLEEDTIEIFFRS